MAQEAGVSGKGNAQIKKPSGTKTAPILFMGNTEGSKYGMNPHKRARGK